MLVTLACVADDGTVLVGAYVTDSPPVSVARDCSARRVATCLRRASVSRLRASCGAMNVDVPSVFPSLRYDAHPPHEDNIPAAEGGMPRRGRLGVNVAVEAKLGVTKGVTSPPSNASSGRTVRAAMRGRRRKRAKHKPTRARKAHPPTTPPAIAPVGTPAHHRQCQTTSRFTSVRERPNYHGYASDLELRLHYLCWSPRLMSESTMWR